MRKLSYKVGQSHLLRLSPGEDLLVGLYRVCRERDVRFGVFQIMGALRSAILGHLDQESGEVRRQVLDRGHDLVSCNGNISPQQDSTRIRAYAVLSDARGQVSAGELLAGEVYVGEVNIQELLGQVQKREQDPETGLWLWPVL